MKKKDKEIQLIVSTESGIIQLKDTKEYAVTFVLGSFPTIELARGVHEKVKKMLEAVDKTLII